MPEKILPLLSAYMWDLRVECEAQLRALTLAQRLLDEYREAGSTESREKVKRRLKGRPGRHRGKQRSDSSRRWGSGPARRAFAA